MRDTPLEIEKGAAELGKARPRRSCLATPGSDLHKMEKAAASGADMVFFDLEDAVAPNAKKSARDSVVSALASLDFGSKIRVVRINSVKSRLAYLDVRTLLEGAAAQLDCIMLPKVESPDEVHFIDHLLASIETDVALGRNIGLEVLMESSRGVMMLREILDASDRIETAVFGPGDYALSIGINRFDVGMPDERYEGHHWHWVMAQISNHAHARGCQPIDGPYVRYADRDGFVRSAQQAKALGFMGKWCIHPSQIEWANDVFSTSPDEVARAEEIISAYGKAMSEGRGAIAHDGLLVDDAMRKMAEAVIASAGCRVSEQARSMVSSDNDGI